MSIFDGIQEVKTYNNVPSLRPNTEYDVTIVALGAGTTPREEKKFFRATVAVDAARGEDAEAVGSEREIFLLRNNKYPSYFLKDVKGLMQAAMNDPKGNVDPKWVDEATTDKQPLKSYRLRIRVSQSTGKDGSPKSYANGDPILSYAFSPLKKA